MPRKRTAPAKPAVVEEVIDLRGKTGPEIAGMVNDGELSMEAAESFVAERAVRKLQVAFERLSS